MGLGACGAKDFEGEKEKEVGEGLGEEQHKGTCKLPKGCTGDCPEIVCALIIVPLRR